jgi:hypothetical protein
VKPGRKTAHSASGNAAEYRSQKGAASHGKHCCLYRLPRSDSKNALLRMLDKTEQGIGSTDANTNRKGMKTTGTQAGKLKSHQET